MRYCRKCENDAVVKGALYTKNKIIKYGIKNSQGQSRTMRQ
jgi:hypothetical protein